MQQALQTGLSAGMSAVSGIHSSKPTPAPTDFDGLATLRPQSEVPTPQSRVNLKSARDEVQDPYISIGAWSWGDTATFNWKPEQLQDVKAAWKLLREAGLNFIDTAQAYGSGKSERI